MEHGWKASDVLSLSRHDLAFFMASMQVSEKERKRMMAQARAKSGRKR